MALFITELIGLVIYRYVVTNSTHADRAHFVISIPRL